jgi:hypothetical protein
MPQTQPLAYRHLIDDHKDAIAAYIDEHSKMPYQDARLMTEQLWDRLVVRLVKDFGVPEGIAPRVMNEALGFLQLAGTGNGNYGPSAMVDLGWHAFLLYTHEYAAFCHVLCGHFIHHVPDDLELEVI